MIIDANISKAFQALLIPKRYKIFYGGRGGAKSWAIAQALILTATKSPKRILCTRELQGSIQESVHKLLEDTINRLQLDTMWSVQKTVITCKNGSNIIFEGLKNNTTKIKSMEGVDIVWCEEAEAISERSWDLLIPTIRKTGSEIWITFNPFDEQDATYQRFIKPYEQEISEHGFYDCENIHVRKVSWRDNPWFPDELKAEMETCKKQNLKKYLHIWEGECSADYLDSLIQPEWVEASIDAHKKLGFRAEGVKTIGFDPADVGQDAKALAKRHGVVVTDAVQWSEGDVSDAIDRAFKEAYDYRADFLVYDNVGVGAAVKVGLEERIYGGLIVHGFSGGATPDDAETKYRQDRTNREVFRNLRAQYWWLLRDRFEATYRAVNGEYIDPSKLISLSSGIKDLSALKSELCRVERKRMANDFIQLESKQDMVRRGVKSPNLADALVYSFANPPPVKKWGKLEYQKVSIV